MESSVVEKSNKKLAEQATSENPLAFIFKGKYPGIFIVAIIGFLAHSVGTDYPVIGGAVIGIILGILIKNCFEVPVIFEKGIEYTMKRLLKLAIILLGFSLSLAQVLAVGTSSLAIIIVSVISGLLLTYWIGKAFGLYGNTSILIGVGTAICGATAIAATAPILKAKEEELTYAINTIFAFNVIAIMLYPLIGQLLAMPDNYFGIWAGTAIHDTSSVVAAGYVYSDEAGATATVVKLVRTLMLIPVSLILAIYVSMKMKKENKSEATAAVQIRKIFPYFILFFVGAAILNTLFSIPTTYTEASTDIAKFLIVMVMVSVGLKTDLKMIKKLGVKPLLVGLIASLIMGMVSISLIYILV